MKQNNFQWKSDLCEKEFLDKPTLGVKELAKKHKKTVEFIKKQLETGIKVELEHTNDKKIAKEIALDHLNELPDYYTRLKKIEESFDLSAPNKSTLKKFDNDDALNLRKITKVALVKENQESQRKKYDNRTEWRNSQGQRHRTNGPAIIWTDGTKEWYQNGKLHRLNGPAIEYADGSKEWYQNGKLHRVDGPAREYLDGTKVWYQNDQLHRLDGPAVEWPNGKKFWYQNDQRHRIDGPAIESPDGNKQWWQNNQPHRTDGPAVELANGGKQWYQNGQIHRVDGPAIEHADGRKFWYLFGKEYQNEKSWEQARNKMLYIYKPPIVEENQESTPTKYSDGTEWINSQGQFHRTDGPAVELADGTKEWWQNGQRHRVDGPAIIGPSRYKAWYVHNQLHRTDGPAVEYADGTKEWFLFDKEYPNKKAWEQARNKMLYIYKPPVVKENQESTPKKYRGKTEWYNSQGELHRTDGPAVEYETGSKLWYQHGKQHRLDGPASEWASGDKSWYKNGKLHRMGGPAVELADGTKMWFQNDQVHRVDGPARERPDGTKEWWLLNKQYPNEKSWEQARNKLFLIYKQPSGLSKNVR